MHKQNVALCVMAGAIAGDQDHYSELRQWGFAQIIHQSLQGMLKSSFHMDPPVSFVIDNRLNKIS